MYSVEELELSLLAWFWNVRFWRDRQASAFTANTNQATGLPESANDLLPTYRAVGGDRLALEVTPVPGDLAASMIKYETAQREWRELSIKPRHQWTDEERSTHEALTHRIKLAAHRLGEKGFLDLRPQDDQGEPQALGEDGMTVRFKLTPRGLEEARRRVRGTKFEYMPRGWEDALAPSEKSQAPEWLQAQWRQGSVTGTGPVNVQGGEA